MELNNIARILYEQQGVFIVQSNDNKKVYDCKIEQEKLIDIGCGFTASLIKNKWYNIADTCYSSYTYKINAKIIIERSDNNGNISNEICRGQKSF
jgi:hypothetical protein